VVVVGISGDSAKNHQLFKKEHNLNFPLLADQKGEIAKRFGVKVGQGGVFKYKGADGSITELIRDVTISRVTVVIDLNGTIAAHDAVKDAAGDGKRIVEVIQKLRLKKAGN
jgi:peroxiredoxin Q/BCP